MVSPPAEPEAMFAATLEVRHECPIGNLSRELPGLRIVHWCVNNRDLFQVSGPEDELRAFREWVEAGGGARHVSHGPDGLLIVTHACRCAKPEVSIGEAIRLTGAWDIPPIVYREGWESWRVLVFGDRGVRELFRELRRRGEVRLQSLRPIENVPMEKMMLIPGSDIFAGLTERQSAALMLGLRYGYYTSPSETTIERLADGMGLAPSTYGEHLRKAEARVLLNLRPYLEAYASRAPGEVVVEDVRAVPGRRARNAIPAESG